MTAHQPAREGDGGSANIDKERPVSFKYTDSFFGSLFFFMFGDLRKTARGSLRRSPYSHHFVNHNNLE